MKKNLFRRNKYNIAIVVVFIIACIVLDFLGVINLSQKSEQFHLNLLTVNSIFLGFLFTSLGMMVGFIDKKSIKSLNTAGYMDNYYNSIYFGLIFLIISTVISTIGVSFGSKYVNLALSFIQQVSFIGGILFFIKSIIGLMRLIKYIRND